MSANIKLAIMAGKTYPVSSKGELLCKGIPLGSILKNGQVIRAEIGYGLIKNQLFSTPIEKKIIFPARESNTLPKYPNRVDKNITKGICHK